MAVRLLPLLAEPTLRLVEAPDWPPELVEAERREAERLTALGRENRSILFCLSVSEGIELTVCVAPWSLATSFRDAKRSGADYPQLGYLGVGVVVFNRHGETLWARRSSQVDYPDHWGFPIAGGVDADASPRWAALAEAEEELGLHLGDLVELKPVALALGPPPIAAFVVYQALLDAAAQLRPNREEVAELRWVRDPNSLSPLHAGADLFAALRRAELLTRRR
jgi:8-oxo-dGTP pyrophosphatase MutT (NUDIX family)